MDVEMLNHDWQLRCADEEAPAQAREWRAVDLPCHVQCSPHGLSHEELYRGLNTEQVAWMADRTWVFRREVNVPILDADREAVLRFKGIDYRFHIDVDGKEVVRKDGMFSHTELSLAAGRHTVEVCISPSDFLTEKRAGHNAGRIPLNEGLKARFSKGWDWAPKLVTLGIWDDVELLIRAQLHIKSAWVETHLSNHDRADCIVRVQLSQPVAEAAICVTLDGHDRAYTVVDDDAFALPLTVHSPTLWWPNGMGQPHLVDLEVRIETPAGKRHELSVRTGLREVRKIPAESQNGTDTPHQLLINGRRVWLRGANWVPGDSCFSTMDAERYDTQLAPYAAACFNIIRVWGGGLIEKDAFYDTCDRLGLMVMQEFPLACEPVPETTRFLRITKQEMEDFVPRLNHRPSIVMWTGGNEHFHYWGALKSGTPEMNAALADFTMTFRDQEAMAGGSDPYRNRGILAIGSLLQSLDGSRPFQPTSGMEGEGEPHGIWNFNPRLGDQRMRDYANMYEFWNAADQHLYSEASVEGIAHKKAIGYVLDSTNPKLPDPDDPVWIHHKAFDACWPIPRSLYPDRKANLWLDLATLETLFGAFESLDDLIVTSHWLQAEGARYMVTELRRKMPRTCGVIWWGANEPWPNLAGNQLVDWFGNSRPALAALKEAFAPVILSLRYRHCVDTELEPELWVSNDSGGRFSGTYEIDIEATDGAPQQLSGTVDCRDYESLQLAALPRRRLPPSSRARIDLRLRNSLGAIVHNTRYFFAGAGTPAPMLPHLSELADVWTCT